MTAAQFIAFITAFNSGMVALNREQAVELLELIFENAEATKKWKARKGLRTVEINSIIDVSKIVTVKEVPK